MFCKRVCGDPTALGLLLRVLPRSFRLQHGGIPPESRRRIGLFVLLRQYGRRMALSHVQHPVLASVAGRGPVLRVYRVQRESKLAWFRFVR